MAFAELARFAHVQQCDLATALHAVTFVNIWAGYPLYMVSLLAGLQGIPKELYEAADIDGANAWEKLRHITIPQLMPIMISIALLDLMVCATRCASPQ